ncbi:MAG: helix-turn-helix transcriptional regulator [Methylobacillus sp.]|nr:helix-turn-helix transcriptional regulator [Methylobacillus sp.]
MLRKMRLDAGLTQEQLALEADLRRTYISILELGQQQPSLTTLFKLAGALNCPARQIIADVESIMQRPNRAKVGN